jgi:hypothetical protein
LESKNLQKTKKKKKKKKKKADEISKNRGKKYTGLERGMKLSLAAKLVLN